MEGRKLCVQVSMIVCQTVVLSLITTSGQYIVSSPMQSVSSHALSLRLFFSLPWLHLSICAHRGRDHRVDAKLGARVQSE